MPQTVLVKAIVAALVASSAVAFSPNLPGNIIVNTNIIQQSQFATSSSLYASTCTTNFSPVFDFTGETSIEEKEKSVSSFERIDDAIMGGISLSALKDVPDEKYASWSGVCRTDGGGFCGMRTLPFKDPLNATGEDGVFIDCKLASDDEADRRMWKMTVRTDSSRGEMVYQSGFDLAEAISTSTIDGDEWAHVKVPFDSFQLVRGPRLVPDGPKIDLSGGIFQIGMTLSKFKMGVNTTVLENFRAGFFDLHVQRIGFYKEAEAETSLPASVLKIPDTLTKKEAERKRPLPLKILLPVAKLLFSEKANRRKSAMNILKEKRNMSRVKAILFGIKIRSKSIGLLPSIFKTAGILGVDSFRAVFKQTLTITLLYPLRLVGFVVRYVKKALGMKVKLPPLKE